MQYRKITCLIGLYLFLTAFSIVMANDNLEAGLVFYQQENYDKAMEYLSQAVKDDPKDYQAIYYFANCLVKTNNLGYAKKYYQKVLDLAPKSDFAGYSQKAIKDIDYYQGKINIPVNINVFESGEAVGYDYSYMGKIKEKGPVNRWDPGSMPLKVYIEECKYSELEKPVWDAIKQWQDISDEVSFIEETEKDLADIQILWRGSLEKYPNYEYGGLYKLDIDGNKITKATLYLNPLDSSGKVIMPSQLKRNVLHLTGHILGISAHSDSQDDIMSPSTTAKNFSRMDKATLKLLYKQ